MALAVGKEDITGTTRKRRRDQGHALAGKSTLNRLELAAPAVDEAERYKKISYDHAIERFFVRHFLRCHASPPAEIVLDLDATDDPVHGEQEGRFFHGFYGHYCYLPLYYVFCGEFLLGATLHTADVAPGKRAIEELVEISVWAITE